MPTGKYTRTKEYREKMSKIPTIGCYPNNHNYTKEEIEIIKNYYPISTKKELMMKLPNRNYQSIKMFTHRIGIKKTNGTNHRIKSKAQKGKKMPVEFKKEQSGRVKSLWENPEYRNNMIEKHTGIKQSEETIRKRVEKTKGENHYNWQGGISKQGYPDEWKDDLKEIIRKRDDYVCQFCGIHQDELNNGQVKKLDVHHKDYNKDNLDPCNLISLCKSCHMKTNHDRKYWLKYFLTQA